MKRLKLLLLFLFIGSYALGGQTTAQRSTLKPVSERISIRLKPLSYILGGHIGVERPLSERLSWVNDLTVQAYYGQTVSLGSSLQWYLTKEPTKKSRWHLRFEAIGGYFWDKPVIDQHNFYAGLGAFVGFSSRLSPRARLYMESGLRGAIPFGHTNKVSSNKDASNMAYYVLISPASMIEINAGFSFDL